MEWVQWPLALILIAGAIRGFYEWVKQRWRPTPNKRKKYNEI